GRRVPVRGVVEVGLAVVDAVGDAWTGSGSAGIAVVHPGVTPGHVLISRQGELRVMGFRAVPVGLSLPPPPGYGAPEGGQDGPALVYGIGALLSELLSGELPPGSASDEGHHAAVVRRALIRVLSRPGARVPESVMAIMRQCLAFSPADRPSLPRLAVDLARVADSLPQAELSTWAQNAIPSLWIRLAGDPSEIGPPPVRPSPTLGRSPSAARGLEPEGVSSDAQGADLAQPESRDVPEHDTEEMERTQEFIEAPPEVTVAKPPVADAVGPTTSETGISQGQRDDESTLMRRVSDLRPEPALGPQDGDGPGDTRPFGLAIDVPGPAAGSVPGAPQWAGEPAVDSYDDAAGLDGDDELSAVWPPRRRVGLGTVVIGLAVVGLGLGLGLAALWLRQPGGDDASTAVDTDPAVAQQSATPPASAPAASVPPVTPVDPIVAPSEPIAQAPHLAPVAPLADSHPGTQRRAVSPHSVAAVPTVAQPVIQPQPQPQLQPQPPVAEPAPESAPEPQPVADLPDPETPDPPPYTLSFTTTYSAIDRMDITCHGGRTGSGLSVTIPNAVPGPCKVQATTVDGGRLVVVVSVSKDRAWTCFDQGQRSCR
ncbi:MAG: hypothetical protein GXP62_17095, partial [Oligoflexia bacterium]|nr:hypothetical protein [Oligoflexia bacterium]